MPIDKPENRGTEKDGSKSDTYCKYCYQNGAFTDPDMTMQQVLDISISEMRKQHLPENIIQETIRMFPGLKRWRTAVVNGQS